MPDPLLPGDGQDALARFKRAREKCDPDMMLELFADDAEYRGDPFEPALMGANAIREHWNRVAAEQTHVDFDAERFGDDQGDPWTSKPGVSFLEIDDGMNELLGRSLRTRFASLPR